MADLLTGAGFVLSVSGVMLKRHCSKRWAQAAAPFMFTGGLTLLLASIAATGGTP